MWRYAAAILLVIAQVPAAKAEQSVNEFFRLYNSAPPDGKQVLQLAIGQTQNGIDWVNFYLEQKKNLKLYCPPPKVALLDAQIIDMLRREVQTTPDMGNVPFGLALLLVSMKVFPCKNSN